MPTLNIFDFDQTLTRLHTYSDSLWALMAIAAQQNIELTDPLSPEQLGLITQATLTSTPLESNLKLNLPAAIHHNDQSPIAIATFHFNHHLVAQYLKSILGCSDIRYRTLVYAADSSKSISELQRQGQLFDVHAYEIINGSEVTNTPIYISVIPYHLVKKGGGKMPATNKNAQIFHLMQLHTDTPPPTRPCTDVHFHDDSESNVHAITRCHFPLPIKANWVDKEAHRFSILKERHRRPEDQALVSAQPRPVKRAQLKPIGQSSLFARRNQHRTSEQTPLLREPAVEESTSTDPKNDSACTRICRFLGCMT